MCTPQPPCITTPGKSHIKKTIANTLLDWHGSRCRVIFSLFTYLIIFSVRMSPSTFKDLQTDFNISMASVPAIPVAPRGTYMHLCERLTFLPTVFLRHQSNCKRLTYLSETRATQSILHAHVQMIFNKLLNFNINTFSSEFCFLRN